MNHILALAGAAALAASGPDPVPAIPYEQFKLQNGLNVILSRDPTAPIVGIDVLYNVGSKDEKPGRTGFAHLFEHLMFEGSEHVPKGEADRLIEAAGGTSNGQTSPDRTEYWEQVPSNAVAQMLLVESDRMGYLLPTLDQAKLDNQREVVRNERRQNYEMQPYGLAWKTLLENLWPPDFPYHWEPIGSHEDLKAATLEDVREFFQRWYGPGNASLAIVGDIDLARARALVESWFGGLPASKTPAHQAPLPLSLGADKRVSMEEDVQLPRLYLAWQSPKDYAPGDAALGILGDILSSGKSSRLVKRLVMDDRIAQSVMAGQEGEALAGMFIVVATPKPGVPLATIEKVIDEELARIAREPPTDAEIRRAKNRIESQVIFSLEPVGGFGGRASHLNSYYWETGDPGYLGKDLERYRAVTAEDVRAAAERYLRSGRRVALSVVPRGAEKAPPAGAPAPNPALPAEAK